MKRMHPGIVWLLIIAVVLVAVCIYRWTQGPLVVVETMQVSIVDEDGNQISTSKPQLMTKPERVKSNGLSHITQYVTRLVNSPAPTRSLIISTLDGNAACLIMHDGSQLMLMEHVMLGSSSRKKGYRGPDLPPQAPEFEKEATIRKLFTEIGIAPHSDFVHDYNGYTDAMRELHYPLGNDVSKTTQIIQRFLTEVYHVKEGDGLDFRFDEQ